MALKIGQQAPAWSGINQHGEHIDSSQFLGKKSSSFSTQKRARPGVLLRLVILEITMRI